MELTYTIKATYMALRPNKNGIMEETEIKTDVELSKLMRTSKTHTQFGMMLMRDKDDILKILDLGVEFIKIACFNDKIREELIQDSIACLNILMSKEVQEDIERFFGTWGYTAPK